ncbi:MAG TPA: phenylalanine--tRNA ligase subunit alpha [Gemmatimonadaceae bacterium]|nr:phenylalanine--tRNA ligase subunit alpha [Gemmatimonadaceae bacterium]
MLDELQDLETRALRALANAATPQQVEEVRVQFLGRAHGELNGFMAKLPKLSPEERRPAGKMLNDVKEHITEAIADRASELEAASVREAPALDLSMPGRETWRGGRHPVTLVIEEIEQIFRQIGFTIALGPEAETEWYNFGALNFPPNHPAMDAHDTIYLSDDVLLRTHTSPVQIRTLQRWAPPIRVLVPGNVYRRDPFDASHAPGFAQIEGLSIDEGVSFVDLKATLTHFAREFFGTAITRFRPSFFPFTEPSAEMDVQCRLCKGAGCSACKGTGWMEILGSGMVHPAVLEASGVDSERYSGWAFGMGPGRVALQRYGIPDIRALYDTDVRVLGALSE